MTHSTESSPTAWTKDDCKRILTNERINGGKTRKQFWDKLLGWHQRKYEQASGAQVPWADECISNMQAVEEEMGLQTGELLSDYAAKLFQAQLVIEPEAPKRKSIFGGLSQ